MSKKKTAKKENGSGSKRVTVASVFQAVFGQKKVPGRPVIVSLVKKKTGKSIDTKQVSWYFSQARKGKLSWQKGKKLALPRAGKK